MIFTPHYNVSYHGEFHAAGIPFEIDDADADELSAHGTLERKDASVVDVDNAARHEPAKTTAKKPGRPKKTSD